MRAPWCMLFDMILDVMGRASMRSPMVMMFDMILDVMGRGINEELHSYDI